MNFTKADEEKIFDMLTDVLYEFDGDPVEFLLGKFDPQELFDVLVELDDLTQFNSKDILNAIRNDESFPDSLFD